MKLLLGYENSAELLVEADHKAAENSNFTYFSFYVINGGWRGIFDNGTIYLKFNSGKLEKSIKGVQILSKDQRLLTSSPNYNDVFRNYEKLLEV